MQDAMYDLEEVERSIDSLERAIETKSNWHVRDRAHLRQLLAAARITEETFHAEIDDASFRSARFKGKVMVSFHPMATLLPNLLEIPFMNIE